MTTPLKPSIKTPQTPTQKGDIKLTTHTSKPLKPIVKHIAPAANAKSSKPSRMKQSERYSWSRQLNL